MTPGPVHRSLQLYADGIRYWAITLNNESDYWTDGLYRTAG